MQYLLGLAHGCWVVGHGWVEACLDAGGWVGEKQYEAKVRLLKGVGLCGWVPGGGVHGLRRRHLLVAWLSARVTHTLLLLWLQPAHAVPPLPPAHNTRACRSSGVKAPTWQQRHVSAMLAAAPASLLVSVCT